MSSDNKDDIETLCTSPWGAMGRNLVLGGVAMGSKFILNVLNRIEITNSQAFKTAVYERKPGQGLVTVSNHDSTLDDPTIPCAILPLGFFFSESRHNMNRWVMCAREICHSNPFLSAFFLTGKGLPVDRGGGLDQASLVAVTEQVKQGGWLHVFPEGKVNREPGGPLLPFKWGVGKIICDAAAGGHETPLVLPFYHRNMHNVKQIGRPLLGVGGTVEVWVGEPLRMEDLMHRCKVCDDNIQKQILWNEITNRIKTSIEDLSKQNSSPMQTNHFEK